MKWNQKHALPHEGVYARIKPSNIHGVGVFAICDIPKDTSLFSEDDSELIWTTKSALKLDAMPQEFRQLYDQFCLIKDKGKTYGCPRNFNLMTIAWYVNHSKTPNLGVDKAYAFYALRDIQKGEELTADYQSYNEFANAECI